MSKTQHIRPLRHGEFLPDLCLRAVFFVLLWWILTESNSSSWLVGIPTVVAATAASFWLRPARPRKWRFAGAIRFTGFFVLQSLRGGVDVAGRAITLNIRPQVLNYGTSLSSDSARALFAGSISLLPGTLTAEMENDVLRVHTLDSRHPVANELRRLEHYVAAVFGDTLQNANGTSAEKKS